VHAVVIAGPAEAINLLSSAGDEPGAQCGTVGAKTEMPDKTYLEVRAVIGRNYEKQFGGQIVAIWTSRSSFGSANYLAAYSCASRNHAEILLFAEARSR
jgi:hypothetical protein